MLRRCGVGIVETSAALGTCLLVLTVAIVLDRRPYRPGKRNYIPIMIIVLVASLVFRPSSPLFIGLYVMISYRNIIERLIATALEHQLRRPPNVHLRDHA